MVLEIIQNEQSIKNYRLNAEGNALRKIAGTNPIFFSGSRFDEELKKFDDFKYNYGSNDDVNIIRTKETPEKIKSMFSSKIVTKTYAWADKIGEVSEDEKDLKKIFITSLSVEYDDFFKQLATELAKEFTVQLALCEYKPDNPIGSLNCQYCGRPTHNVETCDNCGGKPV